MTQNGQRFFNGRGHTDRTRPSTVDGPITISATMPDQILWRQIEQGIGKKEPNMITLVVSITGPSSKSCDGYRSAGLGRLLLVDEMTSTILLPASFIAFGAERLLLAVAHGFDPAIADSGHSQRVLHCTGALITEG